MIMGRNTNFVRQHKWGNNRLHALMAHAGLASQAELARALHMSSGTVNRWFASGASPGETTEVAIDKYAASVGFTD